MRLVRLNLARYGKFTDFLLEFGERQPRKPDFHVVYGPNEAGKTTTLAGFLDLVYGFAKGSTKYDFKHGDATAVGGVVEFSGGATREFIRIKKQANSLLDSAGHVVPDAAILGDLEGLARADYMTKFSLNAETLESGGVDILKSKGDLGQLLFSASAGITDFSEKLITLNEECEKLFKKKGQTTAIAELKRQLNALVEEKTELDMAWKSYSKISNARDEFAKRYETACGERNAAQVELSKIDRLETTVPRFATLKGISDQLESLVDASEERPELKQKVKALNDEDIKLDGQMKIVDDAIETLEEELVEIQVDDAAVDLGDKLKSIDDMRVRFKAASDLSKREKKADEISGEIAGILREIGRAGDQDPSSLLLDVSISASLRELTASFSGLETALETAGDEVDKAKFKLKDQGDKLGVAKGRAGVINPDALDLLGTLVADIGKGGFDSAVRLAVKAVEDLQQDLADAMKPLAPWRGGPDDLRALKIPDAGAVALWSADLDTVDDAFNAARAEKLRIAKELGIWRAKRDASSVGSDVVSDGEAAQKRSDREAAWALHRRTLDGETADAFEERLRADDEAMTLRFSHAGEVAKINVASESVALHEKLLEQAELEFGEAEKHCALARERVAAVIAAVSADLPKTMTPVEFADWAKAIDSAIEGPSLPSTIVSLNAPKSHKSNISKKLASFLVCDRLKVGNQSLPRRFRKRSIRSRRSLICSASRRWPRRKRRLSGQKTRPAC